ncbi:MAG: hypothetical protein WA634_17675 [Silvibacterium sp.]
MGIIGTSAIGALALIGSWFGGFFGTYFKKKGENLATKEDFNDLKEQTRQLRETTKEIESKIDDQIWNRQRQWELKRDILIEFARTISNFEQAVMKISTKIENRSNSIYEAKVFSDALAGWNEASSRFERDSFVAELVVSIKTRLALQGLSAMLRNATTDILEKQKKEAYSTHHNNIVLKLESIKLIIREELGIVTSAMPQSSEFSATPTPDSLVTKADTPACR